MRVRAGSLRDGRHLRYARKVDLAVMAPRGDLSSTGYALAEAGREYLVLQPSEQGGPFVVTLLSGVYATEWHHVVARSTHGADQVTAPGDGRASFMPPFAERGPSVLHLKRVAG